MTYIQLQSLNEITHKKKMNPFWNKTTSLKQIWNIYIYNSEVFEVHWLYRLVCLPGRII